MSLKLLQAGSGASRDFALLYLVGDVGPKLAQALGPDVCVVAETAGTYNAAGPGGVTPWQEAISWAKAQAGDFDVRGIWLIGFSAGCQGVRTQLSIAPACPARHIIACDGIHLPLGNPTSIQRDTWIAAANGAKDGRWTFSVSVSATAAHNFRSTRQSAKDLFGWGECMGSYADPCVEQDGAFRIYGATNSGGNPADEHMDQLRKLLPRMIADARSGGWSVGGAGGSLLPVAIIGLALAALGWVALG